MAGLIDTYTIPPDSLLRRYAGACRYISRVGYPKTLTRAQVKHIHGMDRVVVCNFEDSSDNARGGYGQGKADAEFALGQIRELNAPVGIAVYFSVDFEIHSGFSTVDAYFDAINHTFAGTGYTVGAYGCRDLMRHLFDTKRITYGWQCAAWSYGALEPRAHLYQNQYDGSFDVNQIMHANYGGWTPTGAQRPLPTDWFDMATKQEVSDLIDERLQVHGLANFARGWDNRRHGIETFLAGVPGYRTTVARKRKPKSRGRKHLA